MGPWSSKTSIRDYDQVVSGYLASDRSPTFGIEADACTVAMLIRDGLWHCRPYYGTGKTSEYLRIKKAIKPLRDLYCDHEAAAFGPIGYNAVRQVMIAVG